VQADPGSRTHQNSVIPSIRVAFDHESAVAQIGSHLDSVFDLAGERDIAVVCVGTDRSTGDAFGPIIGSKLQGVSGINVYGTLDEPVHAINLTATLETIQGHRVVQPFIIAIDACLGKFDHVGHIIVEHARLRPGAGVNKSLPEFGDVTLTGVVNVSGFMEYFVLQNTRLGIVMRMADVVVAAMKQSLYRYRTQRDIVTRMHRLQV
jgi:putative sporulation protein YyaC